MVKLLVAAGADPGIKDKDGQSPLIHAANAGSVRSVAALLRAGVGQANDAVGRQGFPLLVHTMASGAEGLRSFISKHGASVNTSRAASRPAAAAQGG